MINSDPVHRHTQRIGADLCHAGLVTLAQNRDAEIDGDIVAVADDDARALVRFQAAGVLDEAGDAGAVISAIFKTTLKRLQFFIAEFSEAALERARIIAAIKNRGDRSRAG